MSPIKNVALINKLGQVVNHVVVDTDDKELLDALHVEWDTHRHVETKDDDIIILHQSEEVWTTHCNDLECENKGFTLPDAEVYFKALGVEIPPATTEIEFVPPKEITINGRVYPEDSLLIKENAARRPEGWVLPEGVLEVSLSDKDK